MALTIHILGLEILRIETSSDDAVDDVARDLSGGSLGSESIEPGDTDRYLGFTNGRGDE